MKLKSEIEMFLTNYGLTEDEIAEFVAGLGASHKAYGDARLAAEAQLQHNAVVKDGLIATIADADIREKRVSSLLSKIAEEDVPGVDAVDSGGPAK